MFFEIFGFLFIALLLGALVLAGVALAGRRESDPGVRRPYAMYVLTVVFLSLAILVMMGGTIVSNATHLVIDENEGSSGENCFEENGGTTCVSGGGLFGEGVDLVEDSDADNPQWAALIKAAIAALAVGAVLRLHWKPMGEVAAEAGVAQRTYGNYLYLTSFTALVVAVSSLVVAVYALVQIIFPGTVGLGSSDAERDRGIVALVTSLVVGGGAALILRYHWGRAVAFRRGMQESAG